MTMEEYIRLRELALKSALDFQKLYDMVPDKDKSVLPIRKTFYGEVPRTAKEIYLHTKNVNSYYFGEIGIDTDNGVAITECRKGDLKSWKRHRIFKWQTSEREL